jgi:hypothetical protein
MDMPARPHARRTVIAGLVPAIQRRPLFANRFFQSRLRPPEYRNKIFLQGECLKATA